MNIARGILVKSAVVFTLGGLNAAAQGSEKNLELTVEYSELFDKEMPSLGVSSPLSGDEKSLGIAIGDDLLEFIANYSEIETVGEFFRKVNNLRNVQAAIVVRQADGTAVQTLVSILPNEPRAGVIQLSDYIISAQVKLTGSVDVYQCIDTDTCVFDETREETLDMNRRGVTVNYGFRTTAACNDVQIDRGLNHPKVQRLVLSPGVARMLRLDRIIYSKVQPGPQLFTANLENFGLDGGRSFPGAKVEAIRRDKTIVLRMSHPNGNMYDAYKFDHFCGV
jgi:hypothetical protein